MSSYFVTINAKEHAVNVEADGTLLLNGKPVQFDIQPLEIGAYSVIADGVSTKIVMRKAEGIIQLLINGKQIEASVESERARLLKKFESQNPVNTAKSEIRAPMPALVVKVEVEVGDQVELGQGLLILEAMKMENEIKAHRGGKVKAINVAKGKPVEKGELLMVLE